ncbi:MAG: ABC transporter permease [Trueperaceae bacterium]|nr:ABC transporter permease [Trueperaceae bacterium]MCO5174576.1 ABC transporter permease [Trueperaceae bacterium]MCW5820135.1 ABC transporter permease [Trueperaceae bacterium]
MSEAKTNKRRLTGLRMLLRSRTATVGAVILVCLAALAAFAPLLAPHDPAKQDLRARLAPPMWVAKGTNVHVLGTDQLGRDILSRVIYGTRISLLVGVSVVLLAGTLGTLLGLLAGFLGGKVDAILMRVVDVFLAFPFLLLAIVFMAMLGASLGNIILVLAITGWVEYARVVRAQVLSVRELEYVTAARALGARNLVIMLKHVLPNVFASVIVIASLQLGTVIISEASLTFLGLGIPPSIPTWGSMLASGREYFVLAWWLPTFPGLAIVLTVLAVNFLGDWLRDVFDPTL